MDKNYNSVREKLVLPEYGRNVVSMVNELLLVEDRVERSRQAQFIIDVMGNINPTLRDSHDYKHKLWDHLFIMSDFKLDIDSPYEKPEPEMLKISPERIKYKKRYITHKQYGVNVREAIQTLCSHNTENNRSDIDTVASNIAIFMRQKSFEYNNEYPSNEVIISDFNRFSRGEVELNETVLDGSKVSVSRANISQRAMQNVRGISQSNNGTQNRNKPTKPTGRVQKNGGRAPQGRVMQRAK